MFSMHLGGIDNNNVRQRDAKKCIQQHSLAGKKKKKSFALSCWPRCKGLAGQLVVHLQHNAFFKVHVVHCCLVSHREREAPRVIHKKTQLKQPPSYSALSLSLSARYSNMQFSPGSIKNGLSWENFTPIARLQQHPTLQQIRI